ncbi:hypothetical protein [Sporosarcina sp. ZBG7A]|uniref:hypothetical protein n=1 Tax=Sporosarcina sp. ZBG7A TaxID=1582223 RepID=UPI00057A89D2|nr:hypothetical protein [Sporosarcina sp. ZBG7A]
MKTATENKTTRNTTSRLFQFYILLLTAINVAYLAIEMYKSKVSQPFLATGKITKSEFVKLDTLFSYSAFIETALIALIGLYALMVFTQNSNTLFSFVVNHIQILGLFFTFSYALSWMTSASIESLSGHLLGPFLITLAVFGYYLVKRLPKGLIAKKA